MTIFQAGDSVKYDLAPSVVGPAADFSDVPRASNDTSDDKVDDMQGAQIGDIAIHSKFRQASSGAPVVGFINSLGTDFRIWDDVLAELGEEWGYLGCDKRGHGLSDVGTTPHAIAYHAGDLEGLIDHLGLSGAIVCGPSVGRQKGQPKEMCDAAP